MDKISISGGKTGSVTPSTALLNQKLGTSPAPRMLTPSEIELLRQSKRGSRLDGQREPPRLSAPSPALGGQRGQHETSHLFTGGAPLCLPARRRPAQDRGDVRALRSHDSGQAIARGGQPERVDTRVLRGPAKRGGQRFLHRRPPFHRTRSRHPLADPLTPVASSTTTSRSRIYVRRRRSPPTARRCRSGSKRSKTRSSRIVRRAPAF